MAPEQAPEIVRTLARHLQDTCPSKCKERPEHIDFAFEQHFKQARELLALGWTNHA